MQIYLARHGAADLVAAPDPYSSPLTPKGHNQARGLARCCEDWDIEFLCASTMLRAQQTADAISEAMPLAQRWDLGELEDVSLDDLMGLPSAGQLVSTWTPEQLALGRERMWIRLMGAFTRIRLFSNKQGFRRVAIVAHASTVAFLLLNCLGLDWRASDTIDLRVDHGATCRVTLRDDGRTVVDWTNRPSP